MRLLNTRLNLEAFYNKLKIGKSLLILDYDGTLAPFTEDRMKSFPYLGVKERLITLSQLSRTRTIIVSGRRLDNLETVLEASTLKLELWGSHGLERKMIDGTIMTAKIEPRVFEGIARGTDICKKLVEPQYCEIKPFAVAFHWRGMEESQRQRFQKQIEKAWEKVVNDYDLELHYFDGGIELRPKGYNKGDVFHVLIKESPDILSFAFLGDDVTDEEAFDAINDLGLKVLVRKQHRPTLADIQISPPDEMLKFLDRWIEECL